MTQSVFDPACFSTYPASNPPKFLHFEYEGSSDIYRYMLVDRFHVNDISPVTKRCQGEADDDGLRDKYINRPVRTVEKEVPAKCTSCGRNVVQVTCTECEEETKELVFGDGKILISPFELGIAFSTQQGSGEVNEKHPTVKKGDVLDESKQDLIFRFMNKESLEVLKWAVGVALEDKEENEQVEQPVGPDTEPSDVASAESDVEPSSETATEPEPNAEATTEQPQAPADS